MAFELAYDLELEVDHEIVFVLREDAHQKVRVLLTAVEISGDEVVLSGNSLGSSFRAIKAAKKEEPPVQVKGIFKRTNDKLSGELELVG